MYEFTAVVIRMNLNVRGQDLVVQLLCLRFDSFEDGLSLLPAQHEDDALNRIVVFLEAELAQARCMPDRYISYFTHSDRHAFVRANYDVANVIGVSYQPYPANVVELSALRVEPAAGIRIVGSQGGRDLLNCQVVPVEASRVKQHLILHHRSAEPGVVSYAVDRTISSLDHPIFNRLQLLRAAVGAFKHVAIHQAAGAEQWRDARSYTRWQRGLSEPLKNNLSRKVIVCAVLESQDEIGQPVE